MSRPMARRRRRGGGRRWLAAAAVILVVAGAWAAWRALRSRSAADDVTLPAGAAVDAGDAVGDRAITLVFPDREANGYVTEQRRLPSEGLAEEDLLQILRALCDGPRDPAAVSGVPRRARPLAVFLDAPQRHAVLDFSSELVTQHPGGSAGELATLTSILRTVALNFPQLETCRILVEGAEVQTLAGHHVLDEPFVLRRWR